MFTNDDVHALVVLAKYAGSKQTTVPYSGGLNDCEWNFNLSSLKKFAWLVIELREESENLLRALDIEPDYYKMPDGSIDVDKLKTAILNPDFNFNRSHWLRGKE